MQDSCFRCSLKGIKKTTLYTIEVIKRGLSRNDYVTCMVHRRAISYSNCITRARLFRH